MSLMRSGFAVLFLSPAIGVMPTVHTSLLYPAILLSVADLILLSFKPWLLCVLFLDTFWSMTELGLIDTFLDNFYGALLFPCRPLI